MKVYTGYTGIITIYWPAMHYILVKTAQELWPIGWLRGCFLKAYHTLT